MIHSRSGLTRYTLGFPLLLLAALTLGAPDFRQWQNLANFGGQICAPLLAALGQLFVTLAGGIDLSIGSVVSLAGCLIATQPDPALGLLLAVVMGVAVGLVNGCGVAFAGVHPLVMTLSSATFLQGLAYVVLPIPGGVIAPGLVELAGGNALGLPYALLWCGAGVGMVAWILQRSRFGLHLYAAGGNPHSAYLNGVRVQWLTVGAYILSSLMAVAAGVFLAARVSSADATMGASFALETVAAVALGGVQLSGGIGSVACVVAGAVGLGLLSNGLNLFGVSPFLRAALTGVLLLLAVSMQRRRTLGL
ncbi:ABC transporter permease [Oxalobacteraceae bacterium]|nr:ABC transporter permease [Oxalobacteraceae bacterium]